MNRPPYEASWPSFVYKLADVVIEAERDRHRRENFRVGWRNGAAAKERRKQRRRHRRQRNEDHAETRDE